MPIYAASNGHEIYLGIDLYVLNRALPHFLVLTWKNMEKVGKTAVFRADMAGLGKYCMGGYVRTGVYRVKVPPLLYHIVSCDKAMINNYGNHNHRQ